MLWCLGFSLVCCLGGFLAVSAGTHCTRFATESSLKEIHRVLRPGATFGMIWNIEDCKLTLDLCGEMLTC